MSSDNCINISSDEEPADEVCYVLKVLHVEAKWVL